MTTMLIYFMVLYVGYWAQTGWSGGDGQIQWEDTSYYFASEGLDNKRIQGSISLFAPSGIWKASKPLSIKRVNKIAFGTNGDIYVGCGWDSAYVFKLGDFGDTILSSKVLVKSGNPGEVTALLYHPDGRVFVGTERGDVFVSDSGVNWEHILCLGSRIQVLYRPSFPWMYIGAQGGVIIISKTDGENWEIDTVRVLLQNTKNIHTIFESSPTLERAFYACTRSTDDHARIFKSTDDGINWELLYTFPNSEDAYSMVEDIENNLYVSTGGNGCIFVSSNGGDNWNVVPSPWESADFYNIIVDHKGILYVGGECRGASKVPKGMVFRSRDKGVSWDTIFAFSGTTLLSLVQSEEGFFATGGDTEVVFISGYCDSGWLVSSIYDAFKLMPDTVRSLEFWKLHFDPDSELKVRVRSSWDIDSLGEWGDRVPNDSNPVNYGGAHNGDRYIQYKAEFVSNGGFSAPILSDICLKYIIDFEGPEIVSAILHEGEYYEPGIDWDDYVLLEFNEPTNCPLIETDNIDSVMSLSNGHSWRSDSGKGVIKKPGEWITACSLKICLSTLKIGVGEGYPPTISIGDTIYPDSSTIQDVWGNCSWAPCNIDTAVGIEESSNYQLTISNYQLSIYPNPFSRITKVKYWVPQDGRVKLSIYDIGGRLIKKLVDREARRGDYTIKISGKGLNSGVYFIRYEIGDTCPDNGGRSVMSRKIICF